jgi:hypothetical protein
VDAKSNPFLVPGSATGNMSKNSDMPVAPHSYTSWCSALADQGRSRNFPNHVGDGGALKGIAAEPRRERVTKVLAKDVTKERDVRVVAGLQPLAKVQVRGIFGKAMFWTWTPMALLLVYSTNVVPLCRIVEQLNLQPLVSKVESGSSVLSRVAQLTRSKETKWP